MQPPLLNTSVGRLTELTALWFLRQIMASVTSSKDSGISGLEVAVCIGSCPERMDGSVVVTMFNNFC